jgi:RNA polymerase sigma-70 factor (ECF subfamily)
LQDLKTAAQFDSILERYGQFLRNAIASHCRGTAGLNVDDIMQEACLRLWRAVSGEKDIAHLPSYLYRIAATVTIDAVRRVQARREVQIPLPLEQNGGPEGADFADTLASPEMPVEYQRLVGLVKEILGRLPAERRRAVGLHLQGWTTPEIARLAGWSESKAKNLVYRGLDDLRRQLRLQGIDYEIE